MVARVTRLVAEKFVLSTFPRALTTLSSMGSRAVQALESSPGLIMMMMDTVRVFGYDAVALRLAHHMTQPRPLNRPPIVEALVDLRASVPGDPKMFKALADALKDEFPTRQDRRDIKAKMEVKDGKLVPSDVHSQVFGGVRIANADQTIYVQFRPDGFTLNNMKIYVGGDQLIEKSLTLWELLVERTKPEIVSRVALRYINRLELPLIEGAEFNRYLTSPPELPEGGPQLISEFLSRIVGHDEQRQATAVVIQQLKKQQAGPPITITVDVNVFQTGDFPVDSTALREVLDSLRMLKNETFFSLLTDETVSFYE